MYIITSGMSPEEEYLAHYGVLGMKWHVHKAKQYRAKGDIVRKKQSDLYDEARNLRAESEYQKQNHNTVTAKGYKKKARDIEKTADKLNKILDKLDKKQNKHNDKNSAEIDKRIEKVKQSDRYKNLMRKIDVERSMMADYEKRYNRGDFSEIDKAKYQKDYDSVYTKEYLTEHKRLVAENDKLHGEGSHRDEKYSKLINNSAHDYADFESQQYALDNAKWVKPEAEYNERKTNSDRNIESYTNAANKPIDKLEKKRKKYVIHTYGVSENELYHMKK